MASPRIGSDITTVNSHLSAIVYRPVNSSLKLGAGLYESSSGAYLTGPETWQTESDMERAGVTSEFAPGPYGRFLLNAGLQSNGNRGLMTDDRRMGAYYDANGTLEPVDGPWKDYRLLLSEKGTLVDSNRSQSRQYALGGLNRFGNDDSLSVYAGYRYFSNEPFFYSRQEHSEKNFAMRLSKGVIEGFRNAAVFNAGDIIFNFPDDPLGSKQDILFSGRAFSSLEKGRFTVKATAAYAQNQSAYAFNHAPETHPAPDGVAAAGRQLLNETQGDAEAQGSVLYRYWKGYSVRFARVLETRRYDYPFSYIDVSGAEIKNLETRDILDDNDTLSVAFPACDTGWLIFSRSSRLLNYLEPDRSAQNRLSSTYRASLSHSVDGRLLRTLNAIRIGVSEDSLIYPQTGKTPGRFYRRLEASSGNAFKAIPGLRGPEDSLTLRLIGAQEENGGLFYDGGRAFQKTGIIREAGATFRCQKRFSPRWNAAIMANYSLSRGETQNTAGEFEKNFESQNLEAGVQGNFLQGKNSASFDIRLRRSRFNSLLTSNYAYINLSVNRDF
jgi:hypothetical protein